MAATAQTGRIAGFSMHGPACFAPTENGIMKTIPPAQTFVAPGTTVTDSFGSVSLPAGVLWGAQTARSLQFFAIGEQRMPIDIVHALAWVKWAAAGVNREL